ncbi:MAG: hypothetical protein ACRCSF_02325 [Mycobacteriaceae bacterium]
MITEWSINEQPMWRALLVTSDSHSIITGAGPVGVFAAIASKKSESESSAIIETTEYSTRGGCVNDVFHSRKTKHCNIK